MTASTAAGLEILDRVCRAYAAGDGQRTRDLVRQLDNLLSPIEPGAAITPRFGVGAAHEAQVYEEIADRGWFVTGWGVGALPHAARQIAMALPTPLRQFPDFLAIRQLPDRVADVVLIDAKLSIRSSVFGSIVVSASSWAWLGRVSEIVMAPAYLVDAKLGLAFPVTPGAPRDGEWHPGSTRGSGEPFWRIPVRCGLPLDDVFGVPTPAPPADRPRPGE